MSNLLGQSFFGTGQTANGGPFSPQAIADPRIAQAEVAREYYAGLAAMQQQALGGLQGITASPAFEAIGVEAKESRYARIAREARERQQESCRHVYRDGACLYCEKDGAV